MRRSLKWVLTLLPVTAASVGTAIYLTSENSISSLNEVNLNRKNVQIETRIAPLASSQEAKENIKAELVSPEKPVEEVLDPKKLIIPEKIDAPTKTETVKSEEKQKTPEKDVRKPILIGETQKTKPISKKPDKKTTTIAKPDVVVVLPQTKTTEPKKEENQKIVENKNKEKVIIANSKKEDVVIPRKTDLPIEKILVFPETKVEEPKIVQKPIESPIVGTIENKSSDQKAKIAVKSAIIPKPSQDEKEKEIKKQQELEIKIKAEKLGGLIFNLR